MFWKSAVRTVPWLLLILIACSRIVAATDGVSTLESRAPIDLAFQSARIDGVIQPRARADA